MIHQEEFRCTQETAINIIKQTSTVSVWTPPPFPLALGVPMIVSEDVPVGKLQFWRDGEMIKEIDI